MAADTYAAPGDVGLVDAIWGADLVHVVDDRVAVIDLSGAAERRWTRRQLALAVARVAQCLRSSGVTEDDVVGLVMENSVEFIAAFHGILAAGAVVLPLDPRSTASDWTAELTVHGVEALIAGERQWRLLASQAHAVRYAIVLGATPDNGQSWAHVLATPLATDGIPVYCGGARTAVLAASSGTQGKSKMVTISHHNLVANLAQIGAVHRLTESDTALAVTPLRHIYGMQMAMNHALLAQAPLVIAPSPVRSHDVLDVIARHQVTVAYLVPSVVGELGSAGPVEATSLLRLVVSGGAPLAVSAAQSCSDTLGVPVVQGYGMTEAGCITFTPDGAPGPATSVGVPVPGTEVRFVDPKTGTDADDREPGEMWIRGPQVSTGYVNDPDATAALIDDEGWLHTGDLAVQDPDGYVSIVGRLKDLIKYKGHQVAPAELEEILLAHPAIADAAVFGVTDPVAGELPKAFVVRSAPVSLTDLVSYVADRVAPHKRIRLIEAVPEIPRSSTGKVARDALLEPGTRLRDLSVVVSGGGRGLGRAFAERLVGAQASLLITGREEDTLRAAAADMRACGGRVSWAAFDVRDGAAAVRAIEEFGKVDVLVNNAGVAGPLGATWEVDADDWWHTIEVNLRGTELLTRAVVPGMIARGMGRIVTVVSNAGRAQWPCASAYSVSKAAQIKLAENLAKELHGTGVVALAYDPGLLDIGITRAHLDRGKVDEPGADAILQWLVNRKQAGRFDSIDIATSQLLRLATGAADDHTGRHIAHDEDLLT